MTNRKTMHILVFAAIIYCVFSIGYSIFNDSFCSNRKSLDENISVKVVKANGNVQTYESNSFPVVSTGDEVYATIHLPEKKFIKNATLCLFVRNAAVSLSYQNSTFYSYGSELKEQGKLLGNHLIRASIPTDAWGDAITLHCSPSELRAFSKLSNVMVMNAQDSARYPLLGHELDFLTFITVLVSSILLFVFSLFYKLGNKRSYLGIMLSVLCFLMASWYIGYTGMAYLLFTSENLCATIEYLPLFVTPLAFFLYVYHTEISKNSKKLLKGTIIFFAIFIATAIILNATTTSYNFPRLVRPLHVFIIIGFLIVLWTMHKNKKELAAHPMIIPNGIFISLILFTIELICFNLDNLLPYNLGYYSAYLASCAILVFLSTVIINYVVYLKDHFIDQKERTTLNEMAFIDRLTGIPNRASCDLSIQKLKEKERYVILFFDLNNLKTANDSYGHEVGDAFIRYVALSLHEIFGNTGFCARYGGDEFVAGLWDSDLVRVADYIRQLEERIDDANEQKLLPLEISVSYGYAYGGTSTSVSIEEALEQADSNMYKMKQRYKEIDNELYKR